MVKIFNEFGENKTGKIGDAIYQNINGVQVRRKGFSRDKNPSPNQIKTRKRFTDAVNWVKTLSYEDKQGIKKYYNNSIMPYSKGKPSTWYNFAKNLFMTKPSFFIKPGEETLIKIQHPGIFEITTYSSSGVELEKLSDLSNLQNGDLLNQLEIILLNTVSVVTVKTVTEELFIHSVDGSVFDVGYKYFDSTCFVGNCWE